jgi:hypothetical protein
MARPQYVLRDAPTITMGILLTEFAMLEGHVQRHQFLTMLMIQITCVSLLVQTTHLQMPVADV